MLIMMTVYDWLCSAAVQALVDESGCKLENPAAARFRMHVVNGNWDMVHDHT
jgi:hypothetical protein